MGEKFVIGPINKGLRNDRTAFNIDDDSFPVLINAYQWRGRIKRKRGTSLLGRLKRFFVSIGPAYTPTIATYLITLDGSGNGNILGPYSDGLVTFSLQVNGNIVPGSVTVTDVTVPNSYTDPTQDGYLTPTGTSGPNTINYATGAILIPAAANHQFFTSFLYYPDLPVMGLEDLVLGVNDYPGTLGFDTVYSYNINTTFPYSIYDVSFYKNPAVSAALPGYVPKGTWTGTSWNGQDYQQFWTVNYQGALWATNGITVPFSTTNVGMQYAGPSTTPSLSAATRLSATTMQFTIVGNPLIVGDFVFANEFTASGGGDASTLNFQTGYVTAQGNAFTVTFPNANITAGTYTPGILQYLTNRADLTKDSLRWYDGDPTNGNAVTPGFVQGKGWVNFAPPLSQSNFSIADLPAAQYYLVGARMIVPFKDRLLFIGPVVQTSGVGSQVYLQDTVIYSQNGTPYYTSSFTGSINSATTIFNPILLPLNQTSTPSAYFEDQTGFGGFIQAGVDQPINTVSTNEDVLIMGFQNLQARFVYSGNDIIPFNFFIINSELGSSSTFSAINLDKGVMSRGSRAFVITSQTDTSRIDLSIPDEVFQISGLDNGTERLCSQRDYIKEWVYFTYPANNVKYKFPNQTLQFNYRDNSWAIFKEAYTTYGTFRKRTGLTWATVGTVYPTWKSWNTPWNSGTSTLLKPLVIAGNQQGFVLFRDDSTDEADSLSITSFSGSVLTSPNHCLNKGDYIIISGCIGTIGTEVNNKIFSVGDPVGTNSFALNPPIGSGTYFGGGLIKRMYVPFIQTKQFPTAWSMARKTRLGPQQYLLSTTNNAQIQLLIYLSQNADDPYNDGPLIPDPNCVNNGLIYSTVLYTCPESANLGLTPFNTNLQMISDINNAGTNASSPQSQIWHRVNTSLIGDTVQIGFTLSDAQMRDTTLQNQFAEIELHSMILDVSPSQLLA